MPSRPSPAPSPNPSPDADAGTASGAPSAASSCPPPLSPAAIGADFRAALVLLLLAVAVPLLMALFGRTPVPLNQRQAMLPWSLTAAHAASASSAAPPPAGTYDSLWWDGVAQFLSWRATLGDALRHGQVPLWSPWAFCGQPFAANGQSACFYPPAMLLCWLLPPVAALTALWILHLLIAACLTWALARRFGASHLAGAAAGVIYATGGFMLAWVPVPSLMMSATWLPGAILGLEYALHSRRVLGALTCAASLALAVLAGHLQVAGYVWLTAAVWAVVRLFLRAVRGKPWPVVPVLSGFLLAAVLSACQWLPTAELGRLSPRGAAHPTPQGFFFASRLALKPLDLSTLVWPAALGLPRSGNYVGFAFAEHFLGLGPLALALGFLALYDLRRRRHKWTYAFAAMSLVALLVALGTPLAALIYYHVPFLGLTGGFQRASFIFCLAWAVLAGFGLDVLAPRAGAGDDRRRRLWRLNARGLLGVQAILLILFVLPFSRAYRAAEPTPVTGWLASHTGPQSRVLAVTPRSAWTLKPRPDALLPPNTAAPYHLRDVQGYDSLYPRAYKTAAARWEGADPSPVTNGNMVLLENVNAPALGTLGVRYVVTEGPVGSTRLRRVAEFGPPDGPSDEVCVYERRDYEPRFRLLTSASTSASASAAVGASASAATASRPLAPAVLPLKPVEVRYDSLRLAIPPDAGGVAEVADTPYPGWRAYLDGKPVAWGLDPSLRLVRTVAISPSTRRRTLDFVYLPTTVLLGGFLSLLALALAAGLLLTLPARRH